MRQFAVIGLGNFGSTVARTLSEKGLPVIAIDRNPERVESIRDLVTQAVVGDASDPIFLGGVGISEVDVVLVALGDDIEASVLVTLYLHEIEIDKIIVKGISKEHGEILTLVGASEVVYPENEMAERVASSLSAPNIIDHIPLAEGYSIVELIAPQSFINKTLLELNLRREYGVEVLVIKRGNPQADPPVIVVPGAGEIIRDKDKMVILGASENVERINKL